MLDTEYTVEVGLLRKMREFEKQVAEELGPWTEKKEVSGAKGGPVVVKGLPGVSMTDL